VYSINELIVTNNTGSVSYGFDDAHTAPRPYCCSLALDSQVQDNITILLKKLVLLKELCNRSYDDMIYVGGCLEPAWRR
jgi:hypothetical protein